LKRHMKGTLVEKRLNSESRGKRKRKGEAKRNAILGQRNARNWVSNTPLLEARKHVRADLGGGEGEVKNGALSEHGSPPAQIDLAGAHLSLHWGEGTMIRPHRRGIDQKKYEIRKKGVVGHSGGRPSGGGRERQGGGPDADRLGGKEEKCLGSYSREKTQE